MMISIGVAGFWIQKEYAGIKNNTADYTAV
jgi:hypothetical protein